MFAIDPLLAALALAPVPIVVATAARYSRLSRPALQEVQQRLAELTAEAEESVSGIRVVKAFAREEHMLHRFQRSVGRVFDQNVYSTRLRAFYNPLMGFLPSIGLAVVLFVGGNAVIDGTLTLGEFTAFYAYVIMLTGPMRMLGTSLGMAQRAAASGNRMFEILDRAPQIESAPDAPALPDGSGQVELHDVTLRYGDGTGAEPALESVSMAVAAGSTVALVGPTGSGKTSLVALLARLYDPTSGSVSIDGADLRDVDVASVRRSVSFVADESFLFSASVAENIAYARPDATQEEIEKAARLAQAHGFIERLPDGYETVVGDRGLTLSGGQRQRVAIARAVLADPRILILDDATSSVDASTEAEIKRGPSRGDARENDVRGGTSPLHDLAGGRDRGDGRRAGSWTAARTRSCSSVATSTGRSPSTGARTRCSCSTTWRSARRWRACERLSKRSAAAPGRGASDRGRAHRRNDRDVPRPVARGPRRGRARQEGALDARPPSALPEAGVADDGRPGGGDRRWPRAPISGRAGRSTTGSRRATRAR